MPIANLSWHSLRKRIHVLCCVLFVALPFLNIIRFDIPKQRFYFAGYQLWISEFGIVFFALMFLMFVIVAMSVFYGRVYCSYLCPQMIFSEASAAVEERIRKWVTKKFIGLSMGRRRALQRLLLYAVLGVASIFLAFVFISYFVEPRDLFGRLASLDISTAAGISGAVVTLITFLDFTLVRQRFCTTVCPYGYLQGMLGDRNTLLVVYRDEAKACIECKKCVRVCEMGIDIRTSPFQIECVHCGECIDACDEILGKLKKPGLIHYAWGEHGETVAEARSRTWYQRIGLRDAKRVVVLLVLTFYASGLFIALGMRRSVLVRVNPERGAKLYRVDGGRVYNTFRYSVSNRGGTPATVVFSLQQLPGASLALSPNPVPVKAGETVNGQFDVSMPEARASELVSHFSVASATVPGDEHDDIPMTFLAPPQRSTP